MQELKRKLRYIEISGIIGLIFGLAFSTYIVISVDSYNKTIFVVIGFLYSTIMFLLAGLAIPSLGISFKFAWKKLKQLFFFFFPNFKDKSVEAPFKNLIGGAFAIPVIVPLGWAFFIVPTFSSPFVSIVRYFRIKKQLKNN